MERSLPAASDAVSTARRGLVGVHVGIDSLFVTGVRRSTKLPALSSTTSEALARLPVWWTLLVAMTLHFEPLVWAASRSWMNREEVIGDYEVARIAHDERRVVQIAVLHTPTAHCILVPPGRRQLDAYAAIGTLGFHVCRSSGWRRS